MKTIKQLYQALLQSVRYRPILLIIAKFMIFALGVRLTLMVFSFNEVDKTLPAIFAVFGLGLLADLMACLSLTSLLWLGYAMVPSSWFSKRQFHLFTMALIFLLGSLIVFGGICELLYWFKFGSRFDFAAVAYLIYPTEVFGNLKASYPTKLLTAIIFFISGSFCYLIYKYDLLSYSADRVGHESRKPFLFFLLPIVFSCFYLVHTFQLNSLPNKYNRELAQNGTISFLMAFRGGTIDFLNDYKTIEQHKAKKVINQELKKQDNISLIEGATPLSRMVSATGEEKRWNVVHIVMEGLSLDYTSDKRNNSLTPFFDDLKGKSLYFSNYYAVGERTVRGLEGLTLTTLPTLGQSLLKRDNLKRLPAITDTFGKRGYQRQFIYPGHAQFDNMDQFYKRMGFEVIDIASEQAKEKKFINIWGASDEDLFHWAINKATKTHNQNQPFYQLIMTLSNHQPYLYPKYPEEEGYTLEELSTNIGAVKYADYALKQFFREAEQQPWFKNTIFVINADHCASNPDGWSMPVEKFQIPLIVYAPTLIKPQRNDTLSCQVDTIPTVYGLMNWSYQNNGAGQDILKFKKGEGRAFFGNYQTLSYLYKDKMVSLLPGKENHTFIYNRDGSIRPTQTDKTLEKIAISWYQTACNIIKSYEIPEKPLFD